MSRYDDLRSSWSLCASAQERHLNIPMYKYVALSKSPREARPIFISIWTAGAYTYGSADWSSESIYQAPCIKSKLLRNASRVRWSSRIPGCGYRAQNIEMELKGRNTRADPEHTCSQAYVDTEYLTILLQNLSLRSIMVAMSDLAEVSGKRNFKVCGSSGPYQHEWP